MCQNWNQIISWFYQFWENNYKDTNFCTYQIFIEWKPNSTVNYTYFKIITLTWSTPLSNIVIFTLWQIRSNKHPNSLTIIIGSNIIVYLIVNDESDYISTVGSVRWQILLFIFYIWFVNYYELGYKLKDYPIR